MSSVQYPVILQVLQLVADGKTEREACAAYGLSIVSFRHRIQEDDELRAMYAEAVKTGNDALADVLIDIDKVHSSPAMAGVISSNIKWLLERRNPDKYGARVTVLNENRATQELVRALDKAIDRIPNANAPLVPAKIVTDVEILEIVDPVPQKETVPSPAPSDTQVREDLEALRLLGLA